MMKNCINAARNLAKGSRPQHESMNTLRVASFSYVSHNNEHNVGAPPPRSPPKVNLTMNNDPKDEFYNKKTRDAEDQNKAEDDSITDKAKRGTKGVVETAFDTGAVLAEGMEKSWGHLKETTVNIKDTVVGNEDDENNEKRYGENNSGDQGKKAGGYEYQWRSQTGNEVGQIFSRQ